ncbi:MAG: amidase [Alphaproteobacteria bacterium]|nr:amidase [Alphaproteobacteria bacterium]
MDDLHWLSATELLAAYKTQTLSPVEVTEYLLGRIEALDAQTNAFCLIDADTTLAQARASEERWLNGEPCGALDGVPVAVKDLVLSKGWPTLRGSKTVARDQAWDVDAPSVARLREHGAVLIGKTTTPEFGWKGTNDAPLTGITRNPWDLHKTPGGSSGGAGAALAAGYCPIAIGTDAGGSIRIPSSFSGVFGLKPTFGLVAAWPASPFGTLAHLGPMTRTVEDAALFLNVVSEPDARDWFQQPFARVDFTQGLERGVKGARIAFSPRPGWVKRVDPEVETCVAAAAKRFGELGAVVEQIDPPGGDPSAFFRVLYFSGAGFLLGDMPEDKLKLLDPNLRALVEESRVITRKDFQQATAERAAYGAGIKAFMQDYDFLLTPATAVPAFDTPLVTPFDPNGKLWMEWTPFTYPFNLTTQPAASICCGFTQAGLPVGLQIVGRMGDDARVLQAAHAFEQIAGFSAQHPKAFA